MTDQVSTRGFTGPTHVKWIHEHLKPSKVRVAFVTFDPGVTSYWHVHHGGQVLHVTSGRGRFQSWGHDIREILPGDTIAIAADEKHWHGAAIDSPMTHLAVSIDEVEWMEPPE